jgi:hypothetical protein
MHPSHQKWKEKINVIRPRETRRTLARFQHVDQTAFADVGEANDADGNALRHARFVRLE